MRAFSLLFCGILFLAEPTHAQDRSTTPYTDQIVEALATPSAPADIDSFLKTLPEAWRARFILVYGSQSLQSASLERPRVMLRSPDNQFFLAFSDGAGPRPADQTVEIIETYGLEKPRFTQIAWIDGKTKVVRDPEVCAKCHQGAHIFESYPHWPGFFGSSHNGRAYGEPSGSARLAKLEFEEQALERFRAAAPGLPRYRSLLNLEAATVPRLERQNAVVGALMNAHLNARQSQQVYQSIRSLEELRDSWRMSMPFMDLEHDRPDHWPELADSRFGPWKAYISSRSAEYTAEAARAADRRFGRMKKLIEELGTDRDRRIFADARPFSYVTSARPDFVPYPPNRTDLGLPVPEVMNYFDDADLFKSPAMYYQYWRTTHPDAEPLPMNNGIAHFDVRYMTGVTLGHLLSSGIIGFEDLTLDGNLSNARCYRDFDELFEWVPLPLKQYTWEEVSRYPELAAQFREVQDTYLELIEKSPVRAAAGFEIFRKLKSWSPEGRARLEALIARGREAGTGAPPYSDSR